MDISLSKDSDVPVHEQLAEQIVFLITTGKLRPAEQLPSGRALARRLAIHHNTVDLVQREWLSRRKGSRLCVASAVYLRGRETNDSLDELIDRSTERRERWAIHLRLR
jgi:DNA-binding transcriptional regulator YhcF (GntR family)